MPTIAVTGGIATGKTAFRKHLAFQWKTTDIFDADAYVTELIEKSETVRREIEAAFGRGIYRQGKLNREQMRSLIFSNAARRNQLENILHPRVQAEWRERAANSKRRENRLLVEIPLLYETGGSPFCDFVVVVACPLATQVRRITTSRGLEESFAHKIIHTQIAIEEKIRCANEVIWNDGPEYLLQEQAALTASYLMKRYG